MHAVFALCACVFTGQCRLDSAALLYSFLLLFTKSHYKTVFDLTHNKQKPNRSYTPSNDTLKEWIVSACQNVEIYMFLQNCDTSRNTAIYWTALEGLVSGKNNVRSD